MKISDLGPLDKVFISKHVFESPETLIYVDHRDAGDLDFICSQVDSIDDMVFLCAAFLLVQFPQLRKLGDVPLGHTATFDGESWQIKELPYDDGDSPGEFPPPAERTLGDWLYTCACCGERKSGLPELSFAGPVQVDDAEGNPDYEILQHGEDLCCIRIEGKEYFWIRALLPLRINDAGDTWCYGVWTTISGDNFKRYDETFKEDQRDLGTMFGYLSNVLPGVPNSLSLILNIVPSAPGKRPWLLLKRPEESHPLFDAQQNGITLDTLMEWIGPHLSCDGNA